MTDTRHVLRKLRDILPARTLTQAEAFHFAEQQAMLALKLFGEKNVPIDVAKVADLPTIEVRMRPRHQMTGLSGFTCWDEEHARWVVTINRSNVEGRRRFTLAHEFKHILDHARDALAYANLGAGNAAKRQRQIEQICDHFAACLLMPTAVVKKMWQSGIQDVETLALLFKVSAAAMHVRLSYLGFLDDELPVRRYFRTDTPDKQIGYGLAA